MQAEWSTCRQYGVDSFSQVQLNEITDLLACKIDPPPEITAQNFNVSDYDIGMSPAKFQELFRYLQSLRRELKSEQKAKIALTMYLMRLRTGDFLYRLQKTFHLSYETQKKYLNAAQKSLLLDFVPSHLDFENITRQKLVENSSEMAHQLYNPGNHVILIADASYIFYEKSDNHDTAIKIQRDTYSDQKKRNFVKPMNIVTSNGFFVDTFGPFKAKTNDAAILRYVFDRFGPFPQLETNDIFLLDRGFRDCEDFLKSKGFIVKMPEFIEKKDKTSQLSTPKANTSRLVTACRFVIE